MRLNKTVLFYFYFSFIAVVRIALGLNYQENIYSLFLISEDIEQ